MKRLVVGMIGLGPGAEPHARCLAELHDQVELRIAVTRSEARAHGFATRFGVPASTDIQAAIADPAIDAMLVLTPPASHLDIAGACLAAGKHVLVEKPLELTIDRGERLVAAARAARRTLGVVLQHRFRPAALRLRAILASGTIGEVQAAAVTVPWWRPQSYYDEPGRGTLARDGGGVLLTQGIHTIDLFRSLLGVHHVAAALIRTTAIHRMPTEDYAAALLHLVNGAPATLMATTAAYPGHPERIEIIAAHGTANLIGSGLRVAMIDGTREVIEAEGATGSGANIMDFPIDAHRALLADFVAAVQDGRDPMVTGEEALASQRLIDDILAASRAP